MKSNDKNRAEEAAWADRVPQLRDDWLASQPREVPSHTFSPEFEQKMTALLASPAQEEKPARRGRRRYLLIAVIAAVLTAILSVQAKEALWPEQIFYSAQPPAYVPGYTAALVEDTPVVSDAHAAVHNQQDITSSMGGIDLYLGQPHPVSANSGCTAHGDSSHLEVKSERLRISRWTCSICGLKILDTSIQTTTCCLTQADSADYAFCSHHTPCEMLTDLTGWTACGETHYTEWEEDHAGGTARIAPCGTHGRFDHDEIPQIRYAITEYACDACGKVVPQAICQRRTICLSLEESLTYAPIDP